MKKVAEKKQKMALNQKEPENFSADEKEAAQAVINEANAATLKTNKKTLADGIKANIKAK